jgi:hypothetical protein
MAITPSNPAFRSDQANPDKLTLVGYAQALRADGESQLVAICAKGNRIGLLTEADLERGIDTIETKAKQEAGDKAIAGVCVYHGLTKVITAADAAEGGLDAAMAAAQAQLKIEEEQIKKNREAEAKFEQALLGAGVGLMGAAMVSEDRGNLSPMRAILGGMHESLAHDGGASQPKLEQPGLMGSVLDFFGIGSDKQAPATPKPTERFIQQIKGLDSLTI